MNSSREISQDSQVQDAVYLDDLNQPIDSNEQSEDTERNHPILIWVEFGVILLAVLFNALIIGLIFKSRLTRRHPSSTFLGAISVNNILILVFEYGVYWTYLAKAEYYNQLLSNNFSCKIYSFLWAFTSYNAYLLMTGFSVHMLLHQQLQENDYSIAGNRSCCSLPKNPCWKGIATWVCSQNGTLIYLIAASISLVLLCLPNLWAYSVTSISYYEICMIQSTIWGAVSHILRSIWWVIFFITFLVITPLTICGSGTQLFTRSRNVSSTGGESQENIDQIVGLTRLSLVTCTISWFISLLLNTNEFTITYFETEFISVHVYLFIHCIYLLCWPIFCCILVSGIFLEMKRCCASISTAVRRLCCSKRQEERNEEAMANQTL